MRKCCQRIVTESITNAIKHSHATMVAVSAKSHPFRNCVEVEVRDNGAGYSVSSLHATRGIEGMRRHAALMGAAIEFGSEPEATFVRLTMPVRTTKIRDDAGE